MRILISLGVMLCLMLTACAEPPEDFSGGLRVDLLLADDPDADLDRFARAESPRPYVFPRDHGAHPAYRSEWWYLTLDLRGDDGIRFGAQFTLFRQALAPPEDVEEPDSGWRSGQIYMAHLALTDVRAGQHFGAERFARDHPELAGVRDWPFAVWLEDWSLSSAGVNAMQLPPVVTVAPAQGADSAEGADDGAAAAVQMLLPLLLDAATDEFALSLVIDDGRPLLLQGDRGLSAKGPDQASHYLSITRLQAQGEVRIGARRYQVEGLGWLDREWSTSVLGEAHQGWDWFGLHLADGRDLMAFQLRRDDGARDEFDAGVLRQSDGSYRALSKEDFRLEPVGWWRDERGVRWPVRWRIHLHDSDEVLTAEALVDDQLMRTAFRYWEGLVELRDAEGELAGSGYLEMTGYR